MKNGRITPLEKSRAESQRMNQTTKNDYESSGSMNWMDPAFTPMRQRGERG